MNVIPLASSSKGNAYLVEHEGTVILIDCGLSYRDLTRRIKEKVGAECQTLRANVSCDMIQAVLITHSHGDHVDGLCTFLKKHDVPVYANMMTAETIIAGKGIPEDAFVCFENGQEFEIGPLVVNPFSIPHDTSDPVGYLIKGSVIGDQESGVEAPVYFHGTDIGTPLDSIGVKLQEATIATLESNHDPVMLRTSGRAPRPTDRRSSRTSRELGGGGACEEVRFAAAPEADARASLAGLQHSALRRRDDARGIGADAERGY